MPVATYLTNDTRREIYPMTQSVIGQALLYLEKHNNWDLRKDSIYVSVYRPESYTELKGLPRFWD
jgi:hypothetical protein